MYKVLYNVKKIDTVDEKFSMMDKSFETPCKYIANYKIKNTGLTPKKVFNMSLKGGK